MYWHSSLIRSVLNTCCQHWIMANWFRKSWHGENGCRHTYSAVLVYAYGDYNEWYRCDVSARDKLYIASTQVTTRLGVSGNCLHILQRSRKAPKARRVHHEGHVTGRHGARNEKMLLLLRSILLLWTQDHPEGLNIATKTTYAIYKIKNLTTKF